VSRVVLLDTGPLVALLCAQETRHAWTVEQFSRLAPPLLTCGPVLAEADHLVQRAGQPGGVVIELVRRGVLKVGLDLGTEAGAIARIQAAGRRLPGQDDRVARRERRDDVRWRFQRLPLSQPTGDPSAAAPRVATPRAASGITVSAAHLAKVDSPRLLRE
jgi:hypothetical protein